MNCISTRTSSVPWKIKKNLYKFEFKCFHRARIPVACVVIWAYKRWGGSWVLLCCALLCSGHSCARLSRGSDVMYNGSPQGWKDGGMREEWGAETRSLPFVRALPCCSDCGRRLMWSHLLHAYSTSDPVAQRKWIVDWWRLFADFVTFCIQQMAVMSKQNNSACSCVSAHACVSAGGSMRKEGSWQLWWLNTTWYFMAEGMWRHSLLYGAGLDYLVGWSPAQRNSWMMSCSTHTHTHT